MTESITLPLTVAEVQKNASEKLRFAFQELKGHQLLDMRVYGIFSAAKTYMPTGKGVSVNVSKIPELIAALQEAERKARELGLIGTET